MSTQTTDAAALQDLEARRRANGEFGHKVTSETSIDLDYQSDEAFGELDAEALLKHAETSARWMAQSRGLDAEDLAGDAVLNVLEAVKRQGGTVPKNLKAYTGTKTHGLAVQKVLGTTRGPDIRGWSVWREACDAEAERLGRDLHPSEEDQIAKNIVQSFTPGMRPTKDFHRRNPLVRSIEGTYAGADMTDGERADRILGGHTDEAEFAPDSAAGRLLDMTADADGTDKKAIAQAKAQAWNLIVEADDAPAVTPNTATAANRKDAADAMKHGGAATVARQILDGSVSNEDYARFSQPWSDASPAQIRQVAQSLDTRAAYASDLWSSAHGASVSAGKAAKSAPVDNGLAEVRKPFLRPESARGCRALVKRHGGADVAARKFLDGQLSARDSAYLLAPWGGSNTDKDTARSVAESLAQSEDGHRKWSDALDSTVLD